MKLIVGCLSLFMSFSTLSGENPLSGKALLKADSLQNRLNTMMQDSASWLDGIGDDYLSDDNCDEQPQDANAQSTDLSSSDSSSTDSQCIEKTKDESVASANGYLQLSWIPRTANLDDVDANFKVALHLPQWNNRFALVIDNDDEDELLLDYESNYVNNKQEGVNVAFQYIKQFSHKRQIKTRVGISRKQLYLRGEMQYNWQFQKLKLNLKPRLDYFLQDGWGPSIKTVANYTLEDSYLSLSATWQRIQSEDRSRRKVGFYHIKPTGDNQLLVSGAQYVKSNNKEGISNETYYVSMRYRNLVYKSWMYIEVEPFLEFNQLYDFNREVGIALSLISYYGQ